MKLARLLGLGYIGVVDPLESQRCRALEMGADEAFEPGDVKAHQGKPYDAGKGVRRIFLPAARRCGLQYDLESGWENASDPFLDPVFFAHDLAGAGGPRGAPVLGRNDGVQAIKLADALQTGVDELPGAGAVGVHLALLFG